MKNFISSNFYLKSTFLLSILLLTGNLFSQTSTATEVFTYTNADTSSNELVINVPSSFNVNYGQPIVGLTISAASTNSWLDFCTWGSYDFTLTVDGVEVLNEVCLSYLVGTSLTGATSVIISANDTDGYTDNVDFNLSILVEYQTPTCPPVLNYFASNFTDNSATISWNPGGVETAWVAEWGLENYAAGTEMGTQNLNDSTINISSLLPNTTYTIRVQGNCGNEMSFQTSYSFTTYCSTINATEYCEDFEDTSVNIACWTFLDNNGDASQWGDYYWQIGNSYDELTGLKLVGMYASYTTNDDYLISPSLTIEPNTVLQFNYQTKLGLKIKVSTTGKAPADFSTTIFESIDTQWEWRDTLVNLFDYAGQTIYIAFYMGDQAGGYYYLDNICFKACHPEAGTNGTLTLCKEEPTVDLSSIITSTINVGTWHNTQLQGLITGSNVNITPLVPGTYTFDYHSTQFCRVDTLTATLTIVDPISAGDNGLLSVCKNQHYNLVTALGGNYTPGGTWVNPSGTVLTSTAFVAQGIPGQTVYTYIVNNNVCPADSATVIVNQLGCDYLDIENQEMQSLTVYPNPTSGLINITGLDASRNYTITIMDVNGRTIADFSSNATTNTSIDASNFINGVYFIQLASEDTQDIIRIVKH